MYLTYLDESGDPGLINSPTKYYVLSCILINDAAWLEVLNELVALRRTLRDRYGIPSRQEIKSSDIKNGRGVFWPLRWSRTHRFDFYRDLLSLEASLPLKAFAIAVEKAAADVRGWGARKAVWTFALQRIHRFCIEEDDRAVLFPDEGEAWYIRSRVREMRRHHYVQLHWGEGSQAFRTDRILEDPNQRKSKESYFIQVADWNALAAHRSSHIDPKTSLPGDLWDILDPVLLYEVNKRAGGPPGIVKYP